MSSLNNAPHYPPSLDRNESAGTHRVPWWTVTLAWVAVGIPLLWGVAQTLHKTVALFH